MCPDIVQTFCWILCFGVTYCLHVGSAWRDDDDVRLCTQDVRKITPFQYLYFSVKLAMCFFVKLLFTSKATPYLNSADQNKDLINFTYYVLQCSTRNYVWYQTFVGSEYNSTVYFAKKVSCIWENKIFQHHGKLPKIFCVLRNPKSDCALINTLSVLSPFPTRMKPAHILHIFFNI